MSSDKANPTANEGLDLSGRTLGDYRVQRRLGQGGMGQVYLAEQVSLRRPVALKILRPELAASPEALKRFKAEAQAVARATHANIVQVYDFDEQDGIAYMALEYVEGRNLKEYLARKGPPELPIVISIMRQVASALQRAGELGIIHRDIKPENILLTRKGEVKVADFGLSRCLEGDRPALNLTQTGVTMGTPLYMSPEQVEGKPLDPRSDIYSFGVTCYHMLTGQPPFRGASAFEVVLQHVKSEPPPLAKVRPDLPEALCAIVHKMMAKSPADRYQTGKDLLRDIVRLREGLSGVNVTGVVAPTLQVESPTTQTPSGGDTVSTERPRPSRRLAALAAAVLLSLLAAAAGGAAFAWKERRQSAQPRGADLPVLDAAATDALSPPSKQEQTLRDAAEQYLKQKAPSSGGVGVCADLGLFYLENDRLADAARLFDRLVLITEPRAYRALGQVGRGIVLALNNDPKRSNEAFNQVFPPRSKGSKGGKGGKGKWFPPDRGRVFGGGQPRDEQAWPIQPLRENPRWRYWLGRARWYNYQNGLPESQVSPVLKRIPLREGSEPARPTRAKK